MNRRQRKKLASQPTELPSAQEKTKKYNISFEDLLLSRQKSAKASQMIRHEEFFKPYEPPRNVLPKNVTGHGLAMDAGFDLNLLGTGYTSPLVHQGYAFPGFQELALWSQIVEYRKPSEVFAREMTRKWIKFVCVGDDDKADKIKDIEKEFKRLNVQSKFREAIEHDGLFGRAHIFIDMGTPLDGSGVDELKTELVESKAKIGKSSIKRLTVLEPTWVYPNLYNANNPIDPTFYKPTSWFSMGTEINSSRLCTIVLRELPDILKPAYAFAGMSLSQLMKPYIDNWLRTRQSVSDLIHSFTVWTLKCDMNQILVDGGVQSFLNRMSFFNNTRDNQGLNAIDMATEDFSNVSASLSGLDKLQAQAQEQICSASSLPLVYATGITPSGLNATSEGEIEVFQDTIGATQEMLTPFVSKIMNVVMLSLFGEIDDDIQFIWEPLKIVTEKEKGEIRKFEAETDVAMIDVGVLTPDEVRQRIAQEEDSLYPGLDLNVKITPPQHPSEDPEMQGFSGLDDEGE